MIEREEPSLDSDDFVVREVGGASEAVGLTVVGGGILAKAISLRLADEGHQVTLIYERGQVAGQASSASGAMLGVFSETSSGATDPSGSILHESLMARDLYDSWLDRIGESSAAVELHPGIFVVPNRYGPRDLEELSAIETAARDSGAPCEPVDVADIDGLNVPGDSLYSRGLFLPTEASLDPTLLLTGLESALVEHPGVVMVDARAVRLIHEGRNMCVHTSTDKSIRSNEVVLACGTESAPLLGYELTREAGLPPVFSGRGVSAVVSTKIKMAAAIRTPNRGFACGSHVVPRSGGRIYLGATNRLNTLGIDRSEPRLDELMTCFDGCVRQINRSLSSAELLTTAVGNRPVTVDKVPLVGRTRIPNLLIATGTYRNGILLAPRVAELIADEVASPGTNAEHAFAPTRAVNVAAEWKEALSRAGESILGSARTWEVGLGDERMLDRFISNSLRYLTDPATLNQRLRRKIDILVARAPMEEALPAMYQLIATQE